MYFKLSLSTLLAGVLLVICAHSVEALPHPKRNAGTITLPLRRVEHTSSSLHPQIYLQQQINRSHRRLARMTGRSGPTDQELTDNLVKRILSIEGQEGLAKRYNRHGVSKKQGKVAANDVLVSFGRPHRKNKGQGKAAGVAAGAGAVGAGLGAAAGSGDGGGSAAGAGASASAEGVTLADTPSANNSLGLDIEGNDVGYLATVKMGTPPRDFLILMDSGSADLWVGSENCVSETGGGCGNHQFLGSQSSTSFKDTKAPFQVTYGTGAVAGTIVQDNIEIAGLSLPAHTFGVADQETVDFSDNSTPFDGLMGLAQSSLSEQKTATPVEALAKAGLITDAITSYKIPRLADGKNDGEITFGGIDATKIDSQTLTTFQNVNQDGFWEGAMDSVTVDGKDTALQGRTAILDTGTTLIVAPPADALAVHQLIDGAGSDGQGGFTVPCDTTASVALSFGGVSFEINPKDLVFNSIDGTNCASGISAGQIGGAEEWLVGDVFLKNAYFSTDVTKNAISLAKLV